MELLDFYDQETKISSMARTTGYTCTAAVNLIAQDLFNEKEYFRRACRQTQKMF
jgi:hypothetical protein